MVPIIRAEWSSYSISFIARVKRGIRLTEISVCIRIILERVIGDDVYLAVGVVITEVHGLTKVD